LSGRIPDKATPEQVEFIRQCVRDNHLLPFYLSAEWTHLREAVLSSDRWECQICKEHGKYSRAVIVHHVNHVRDCPELALSAYYTDKDGKEQRNLISVCRDCHTRVCHPERMHANRSEPLTNERWD